jgi:hypothetical protein
MEARATVWCVLLIALLGGCSQNAGLQQFSQLLPGGGDETAAEADVAEEDLAGGPPLPERNTRRALGDRSPRYERSDALHAGT